ERAEIRFHGTQILDLGSPQGAQHTAGGWMSNLGPDRELDGASAAISIASRAMIAFAADGHGGAISARVRSFRPGLATLYLDDREVASRELREGEWTWVSARTADRLARGEHEL